MSFTAVRFGRYSLALALRSEFFTEFRVDANSYFLKNNQKTLSEFTGSINSTDFRQISLKHFRNNNKKIYIYVAGNFDIQYICPARSINATHLQLWMPISRQPIRIQKKPDKLSFDAQFATILVKLARVRFFSQRTPAKAGSNLDGL